MREEIKSELIRIKNICDRVPFHKNVMLTQKEAVILLGEHLPFTPSILLAERMVLDLYTSPLYTAISSWCDIEYGLCLHYPAVILEVVKKIVPDDSILDVSYDD